MATCAFCGTSGKLTGEHVLGDWLSKIGLDLSPVPHAAGWLNRMGGGLGTSPPYRRKVNDVCSSCNSGWMSRLEGVARRVLTPFILGEPGLLAVADQAAIAAWMQKTSLVAMLVSPEEDRAKGYGFPSSEYTELYALRDQQEPLPASQFWIGRYEGVRDWSVRGAPLVVTMEGLPNPGLPQAHSMTVILGHLVLHGVRFTVPALQVPVTTRQSLPQFWPSSNPVDWPAGTVVDDGMFHGFVGGKDFIASEPFVDVRPWKEAAELQTSRLVGSMIELPTICGKHVFYYPAALAMDAARGRFYAFVTACECETAYLIMTESDGAHCKSADAAERVLEEYEDLPGDEYEIQDSQGVFVCKALATR